MSTAPGGSSEPWRAQELTGPHKAKCFTKENAYFVLEVRGAILLGMNVTLLVKLFPLDCINSGISHCVPVVIFYFIVYNVYFSLYQIHLKPF